MDEVLERAKAAHQLTLIGVKPRDNLGCPAAAPQENKAAFMAALEDGI